MTIIRAMDMQLGDVIRPFDSGNPGPWTSAIVKRITDDSIVLFRPYGVSADFSYTGGVICYTGIEEYTIARKSMSAEWVLLERKTLK